MTLPAAADAGEDGRAPRLTRALQNVVVRTGGGPLRPLWRLTYEALARGYGAWLTTGENATAYACRSLGEEQPAYGLSDIDLAIVVQRDPHRSGSARARVLDRRRRLNRALPWLCETVLDGPLVLEAEELPEALAAPALTYGLDSRHANGRSVYFGEASHGHRRGLADRPGLYGPTSSWRRVAGPARPLPRPVRDRADVRVAAWLEIQNWWRWFLQACAAERPAPDAAALCVKVVADPARVLLWLCHGERVSSRRQALELGMRLLPEEAPALRRALELQRELPLRPEPPMAEFLGYLTRLTSRVADVLTAEVAALGTTPVSLDGRADDALALAPRTPEASPARLLPLADWRALVSARHWSPSAVPAAPDETLAPLSLDPADLGDLRTALRGADDGPYPALRSGPLLVLASGPLPRTQLRAVQCPPTDPVSFALLGGAAVAGYPDAGGWSARDTAERAVAEHGAWLSHPGGPWPAGHTLGMLFMAARAASFRESLGDGEPRLALTVAATLDALRRQQPAGAAVLDEAEDAYRRWRVEGVDPAEPVVAAVREIVTGVRSYASSPARAA